MQPIYFAEFMVLEHGLMARNTIKAYPPMHRGELWKCSIDLPERGVGRSVFGSSREQVLEMAARFARQLFQGKILRTADGHPFQLPPSFG